MNSLVVVLCRYHDVMIRVLSDIELVDFEQVAKPELALMTYSYSLMLSLLSVLLLYRFVLKYFSLSVKSREWGNICA